jgi:hypothetical protein
VLGPVSNYVRGRESITRRTLRQSRLLHLLDVVADLKNAKGASRSIFSVGLRILFPILFCSFSPRRFFMPERSNLNRNFCFFLKTKMRTPLFSTRNVM